MSSAFRIWRGKGPWRPKWAGLVLGLIVVQILFAWLA